MCLVAGAESGCFCKIDFFEVVLVYVREFYEGVCLIGELYLANGAKLWAGELC